MATAKGKKIRIRLKGYDHDLVDKASETVKSGWETVDLSSLGTVTSLTFALSTTDSMCPTYFAIDNLTYEK